MSTSPTTRLKMKVNAIDRTKDGNGNPTERLTLIAVYSPDENQENYKWSQATPQANLVCVITNPEAQNKYVEGSEVFVDITPVLSDPPALVPAGVQPPQMTVSEPAPDAPSDDAVDTASDDTASEVDSDPDHGDDVPAAVSDE